MKKVTQALIMAGGFGARLSQSINPHSCKSLIVHNGQALIGHLIDHLHEAGIVDMVIATNTHSHDQIYQIAQSKGVDPNFVVEEDGNTYGKPEFAGVSYNLKHKLDERFLIVCGHHVVPKAHLEKMITSSEQYTTVATCYKSNTVLLQKTLVVEPDMKRTYVERSGFTQHLARDEQYGSSDLYLRNPYVIDKIVVDASYADKHSKTFHEYILTENKRRSLTSGLVLAHMPPEFDYDWEYADSMSFLEGSM